MNLPDLIVLAFTACNSLRVLAYAPQIMRIAGDRGGAVAVSCWTWTLFALSHLTTVAYALVVAEDLFMALMFGANTVACATIVALTWLKRHRVRHLAGLTVPGEAAATGATPASTARQTLDRFSIGIKRAYRAALSKA